MPTRRGLSLTSQQRGELSELRDHDPRPYVRERCAALLKIADGQSAHAVAKHGLLQEREADTLYDWLNRFAEEGVASVTAHQHGGARRWPFCPAGQAPARS